MDEKPNLTGDDARLLPRFRAGGELLDRHRMRRAQAAAFAHGTDGNTAAAPAKRSVKAEPGDLRGIPVIGQGVGGVSPGSSPESAIDRVDQQRERRRRAAVEESGPREPMVAYG